MITFKQFLSESQNYPLYHGTTIEDLAGIIKSNEIKTGFIDQEAHWPSKTGSIISTSRNFNFSKEWARSIGGPYWVVIELNRGKLKNNYKIVPFNYFGNEWTDPKPRSRWIHSRRYAPGGDTDRNQYEEAITRNIKSPLKYINKVHMTHYGKEFMRDKHPSEYSVLVRHGIV